MTDKRFVINNDVNFDDKIETYEVNCIIDNENETFYFIADSIENVQLLVWRLNELVEENIELHIQNDFLKDENRHMRELVNENEQLKKDVEYWKQVASQYSNELNVFEHCKKYKTECKDIYWSSD